jgi:hypothetical protein
VDETAGHATPVDLRTAALGIGGSTVREDTRKLRGTVGYQDGVEDKEKRKPANKS